MSLYTIIYAVNLLFVSYFTYRDVKRKSVLSYVWVIITYYSLFIFISSLSEIVIEQGYIGSLVKTSETTKFTVAYYVTIFNIIFALSLHYFEKFWNRIIVKEKAPTKSKNYNVAFIVLGIFIAFGGLSYFSLMSGKDYYDYVTMTDSAWSQVFLWAGSPSIIYFAMRRNYFVALALCIPFVLLVLQLKVRSFALLSVVPLIIYAALNPEKQSLVLRRVATGLSVLVVFYLFFFLRESDSLPDAFLPMYMNTVFEVHQVDAIVTDLPGISQYLFNFIRPFVILLGIDTGTYYDTPYYLASIITGSDRTINHFPSLWYSDTYVNFGYYGVLIGIFYALVISLMARVINLNETLYSLFLPYYAWHNYLLIRGATTIASVPFMYSFYVSVMLIMVIWVLRKVSESRK